LQILEVKAAHEKKGEEPFRRKPNTPMALELKAQYPSINFEKSIMVGDTDSDIQFAKALGMFSVLVKSQENTLETPDLSINCLADLPQLFS
ncbi:MAG: HAD hydrolase-like protein, partial [Flavobacteriales bacterium]